MSTEGPQIVYLVVMDRAGLFGCYYALEAAQRTAESVQGIVATAPIIADYRDPKGDR